MSSKGHYRSHRSWPPARSNGGSAAATSVYVGNIPWDAREEEVMELCSAFGSIVRFKLVRDINDPEKTHRGFGFMEFADEEAALSAIRDHKGLLCRHRQLRIAYPTNSTTNNNKQKMMMMKKIKPTPPASNRKPNVHKRIIFFTNGNGPCCNQKAPLNPGLLSNPRDSFTSARPSYPTILEDQPNKIKEKKRSHPATMTSTSHVNNNNNNNSLAGCPCPAIPEVQTERDNEKKSLHHSASIRLSNDIPPFPAILVQDTSKKGNNSKKRIWSAICTTITPDDCSSCSLFYSCANASHESKRQNVMALVAVTNDDLAAHAHHLTCNRDVDTEVSGSTGRTNGTRDWQLFSYDSCIPPKTACKFEADLLKLVDSFSRIHIHQQ